MLVRHLEGPRLLPEHFELVALTPVVFLDFLERKQQ